MNRYSLSLLILLLCFPGFASSGENRNAMEHLQAIASVADRSIGTPGEQQAAAYIEKVFTNLAQQLQGVTGRQSFTAPARAFLGASLTINGRSLALQPLFANALAPEATPPAGLSGKLIHAEKGELQNFNGSIVAGNIILMDLDSGNNWQHAANLGAKAVIYLDDGNRSTPRLRFRDKEELTPVDFPRFRLLLEDFTHFFAAPQALAGQEAKIVSSSQWTKVLVNNLYCFIPGTSPDRADEILLVEAFFDSSRYIPGNGPGADEAVSVATLLELANAFAENPPQHSILLLATSGHANNLAGLKEAVWALTAKKKELTAELKRLQELQKKARATEKLLEIGKLGTDDLEQGELLHKALQDELRNRIESLNSQLRLVRKTAGSNSEELKSLAQEKLLLRRLSWESAYHHLPAADQKAVAAMLPNALNRNRQISSDLHDRITALESALRLNTLVAGKRVAAAVSLHLSSHGNGLGSVDNGWLYQLNPAINRAKQYTHIRPVLSQAAGEKNPGYLDLLGGNGRKQWFNHFPDQPALGGEITALAGMAGFTLATVNDMHSSWGTPYDTLDQVDSSAVLRQAELVGTMIMALDKAVLPEPPYKAMNGFTTLSGRANFLRQGELFPEQIADGVLLQVYQDHQYSLAWVDSLGQFRLPGLADKRHSFGKAIIEGYRFSPGSNQASWAIDKTATGKDRYRVKLGRNQAETDLIMFGCSQTTLFQLRDARSLNPLTRINLLDGRTDTAPLHYWYSRIDTQKSTLASLFLEPDTPVKVTLSDTVLMRKFLLLGNSAEDPLGKGFPAGGTPAIHHTSLRAAEDMMQLVAPRVDNLKRHSIINQRIDQLLQKAKDHLNLALENRSKLLYTSADHHARASLSLIARVYNDVERTQQDVLSGVLFYIALFVPFAYCLERLLFGHVSIHKRILSFLGLLVLFIAVIYAVHPAFQLTYSPSVVILAFFILGLSALVSLLLFLRFEQEMQQLQRKAHIAGSQTISLWGAFVAAFSIGVSNLRRRKVRTALTCMTLIILTYTLLNFTSVRSSVDLGAAVFQDRAAYQGLLLKAPEWKSLPTDLYAEISTTLPGDSLVARRVWWETADKTRPPVISLQFAKAEMMLQGSWLDTTSRQQVLLPQHLAQQLGITSLSPKPQVLLWGIPFTVQGIFDDKHYFASLDLDGEPQTPVVYPNETSSEKSEAEAEAAESGQEIASMASRYRHVGADTTIIIPAATLLQAGGHLKSLAMIPRGKDHEQLAKSLADRYQLLLYHGLNDATRLHYSSSSLSYSGMGNVLIPSIIAVLIVLNTMVGSVMERKREIAVYTSIGLAPPHVASLFIAEALAFGIISSVMGYLAAQIAAHFLAGTSLWTGMTANYSSLAGVGAMLMVMVVVLLSVIYPSRVASRIAIPDVNRSWNLPKPEASTMIVTLPFLIKLHEQDCVGGFLAEYYLAHQDISHGLFSTDEVAVEYACPLSPPPVTLPSAPHPECFNISFRTWLSPFDFGIRQRVEIISCPSPESPGFLEMRITLIRQAGEKNVWYRLCRGFLNDLRKQLLIWRSLDPAEKIHFEQLLRQKMATDLPGEARS